MHEIHVINQLSSVVNCFLISVIGSFARVLLYKNDSFKSMILVFFGGVLFGTLTGYLVGTFPRFASLDKLCTAFAAILGKEVMGFLIIQAPAVLKTIYEKISSIKISQNEHDSVN